MLQYLPVMSSFNFFILGYDCKYVGKKKWLNDSYLLPSTCEYLQEEEFAKVYLGWHEEKICLGVYIGIPFKEVDLINFRRSDSIELFFDTRDLKDKTFISRFCHHFVIFAAPPCAKEITKFRGEDMHPLCDPASIHVGVNIKADSYFVEIIIPSFCLYGYDVQRFDHFGFTYRINRYNQEPQHFCLSSKEYTIENTPSLWCSVKMVQK